MVFAENQEQNESYTFKDIFLQPENSYLFLAMIKEVEAHEVRSHCTLMKKSEVKNKRKKRWEAQEYFIHLVLQVQEIPRWKNIETQR